MSERDDAATSDTGQQETDDGARNEGELSRRRYVKSLTVAGILGTIGSGTVSGDSPSERPQFDTTNQQRFVSDEIGDAIITNELTESIGPGVELYSFDQLDSKGWLRADVLAVDLGETGTSAGLLSPGVSVAGPISELAGEEDAIAGTNGDFFDIGDTNAPIGVEVGEGTINKSGRSATIGTGVDGLARLMDIVLDGSITLPDEEHPLDALNEPSLRSGDIGLYTPIWGMLHWIASSMVLQRFEKSAL